MPVLPSYGNQSWLICTASQLALNVLNIYMSKMSNRIIRVWVSKALKKRFSHMAAQQNSCVQGSIDKKTFVKLSQLICIEACIASVDIPNTMMLLFPWVCEFFSLKNDITTLHVCVWSNTMALIDWKHKLSVP